MSRFNTSTISLPSHGSTRFLPQALALFVLGLALALTTRVYAQSTTHAVPDAARSDVRVSEFDFLSMIDRSFQSRGIVKKDVLDRSALQVACSREDATNKATLAHIEAEQAKTIKPPSDGRYLGDWKSGERIALDGRGMTWTDKSLTSPNNDGKGNGGGCYNCHELGHHELAFGTIGPSLKDYAKTRGNSKEVIEYTWARLYNAKSFNACSLMPRNGDSGLLTEQQIKDLMAFLLDPNSSVNKP